MKWAGFVDEVEGIVIQGVTMLLVRQLFLEDFLWSVDELKLYLLNRNSNEKRLRINKIFIIFLFIRKFVFSASISLFQATRLMFRIAVLFLLFYFVFYSLLLQPLLSAYPYVHKPVFVS